MSPVSPGAQSWEVASRATQCSETQGKFEDGQVIMSRLRVTEDGLLREDYRVDAWTPQLREESLVYWKTTFRVPPPKKEEPFKEQNAEKAFRELLEEQDPSHRNTLFILAVMMERKRILVEQGAQRDPKGNLMRIYEHKENDETFLVYDPELSLDQIVEVQQEVGLKLGWIQPEPDPSDESEADPEEGESEGEGVGSEDVDEDPDPEGGEASAETGDVDENEKQEDG